MVLAAVYCGLRHLPSWLLLPYERVLLAASPLMIMLEALAAVVIILSFGETWSDRLAEHGAVLKTLVFAVCVGVYGISMTVIANMYYSHMIKTVVSASLVAVILTLVVVQTVATVMVEHGTITDSALLFLYVTYSLWTITQSQRTFQLPADSRPLYANISQALWSIAPADSLYAFVSAVINMFSIEIIAALFLQMSLFIMATRVITRCTGDVAAEQQTPLSSIPVLPDAL